MLSTAIIITNQLEKLSQSAEMYTVISLLRASIRMTEYKVLKWIKTHGSEYVLWV